VALPSGRSLIALPAPPARRVARALRIGRRDPWHRRLGPSERRTIAIGAIAFGTVVGMGIAEVGRVWRRGSAPLPRETHDLLGAAETAVGETVHAAVAGYQEAPERANALFNLLASFVLTFAAARGTTYMLRRRRSVGPFRDVHIGRRHIHHFVPGIVLAFLSGAVAIVSSKEDIEPKLALSFGVGMGLTLDESALLLELEDVYWSEEGLLSVQITLAVAALLGALGLGLRFLRRGEKIVLEPVATPAAAGTPAGGR
jgi:hypothetical protein